MNRLGARCCCYWGYWEHWDPRPRGRTRAWPRAPPHRPPQRHQAGVPVRGGPPRESGFIASEGFPALPPAATAPGPSRSPRAQVVTPTPHNTSSGPRGPGGPVPEGQVATLSFRVFDLEPDPLCRFDSLSVFGGHGPGAPLLGRFCGTFRPGALRAPQNRLRLRMESDGGTAAGASWPGSAPGSPRQRAPRTAALRAQNKPHFFRESWHYFDEHQFCGGRLEKPQGSLNTPNWPEENYPPGISCSWHIVGPPDKVVELRFGKFDVEPDPHCRYDYVAVFEGGARDDARRLGSPIVSSTPELLVQFVSDLSVTADGFSASYTPAGPWEPRDPQPRENPGSVVVTGTVKSLSRGPPQEPGWAVVSLLSIPKVGGLGVPTPPKGATLRLQLPCRLCPALKKGSSYVLMGRLGGDGGALLPPDSFVVPYRPQQQQQVLNNLSKRPCRGSP
ncbi:procollagen C-endopeptidase enhancer 1-like [Myiozetetes cayanensis]|uniref:procollagen C-endopeptidase enhancer 1-like n=1 Tax=Myiozetetes cayanensis TaxID=478635 RepID=UPI00215E339A|nr:procollagen C-endopeptidase enhancer 1-like [Myiozetetes cayanensis]